LIDVHIHPRLIEEKLEIKQAIKLLELFELPVENYFCLYQLKYNQKQEAKDKYLNLKKHITDYYGSENQIPERI
jgi:hypothetical protein